MKNFLFILATLCLAGTCSTVQGQTSSKAKSKKIVETSFWVEGDCLGCKKVIEGCLDAKGIKYANYDVESRTLKVAFNPKHITEEKIHAMLNAIGRDTGKSKCSAEQRANAKCAPGAHDDDEDHEEH